VCGVVFSIDAALNTTDPTWVYGNKKNILSTGEIDKWRHCIGGTESHTSLQNKGNLDRG